MRPLNRLQAGFTLLEVQIALLLLLLVMLVLMGSFHLVSKTSSAADKVMTQNADLRTVARLLQRQLSTAMPLRLLEDGDVRVLFEGDAEQLYFMGQLPEFVVTGGPWLLRLYQQDAQLLLDYRPLDNRRSVRENLSLEAKTIVLLDDVDTIHFDYFDGEQGRWQDRWSELTVLPQAVKLQITQHGYVWPELLTAIQAHDVTVSRGPVLKMDQP